MLLPSFLGLVGIACAAIPSLAQEAVPVGAGSYAAFPPEAEGVEEFVNTRPIYVAPGETRPIPTNDWWSDLLASQYGGQLWAYPLMLDPAEDGIEVFLPTEFSDDGSNHLPGPGVRVTGLDFAPTEAQALDWDDWRVVVRMPDEAKHLDVTLAHGIPMAWFETTGLTPQLFVPDGTGILDAEGAAVELPQTGGEVVLDLGNRLLGLHLPAGVTLEANGQQQLEMDLEAVRTISRLQLHWETAFGRSYRIEGSVDGQTWEPLFQTADGDGGVDEITVDATARYLRIHLTGRGTQWPYSLWEWEVYDEAELLSVGKPVSASSTWENYPVANLNDGNSGTRWQADPAIEEYLLLNLPENTEDTTFVLSALTTPADLLTHRAYAFNRPTHSEIAYTYDPTAGAVEVTYTIEAEHLQNGTLGPVLQGFLPHHYKSATHAVNFGNARYPTTRGELRTALGNSFRFTYPFKGILPHFPAPFVDEAKATPYDPEIQYHLVTRFARGAGYGGDTYWGGKDLVNLAKYTLIAETLNHQALEALKEKTRRALTDWLTYSPGESDRYFARYDRWGALIGFNEAYGSAEFTDNHFHYGYLIHAAALYGMIDPDWLHDYAPMLRLVAKQYANHDRSDPDFPFLRTFDPWIGHSYAGGLGSGTGNNQESTSEAMQSWIGLFLLGEMLGDEDMRATGAFGYASEAAATLEYWFDWEDQNWPDAYDRSVVGILWNGGYAYGTYFSASPVHIHGIQYLPVCPGFDYLGRDPTWAAKEYAAMLAEAAAVDGTTSENDFGTDWGNVALGFRLFHDPADATAKLAAAWDQNLPIANDTTTGLTYYYAHAMQNLGLADHSLHTTLPASTVYRDPVSNTLQVAAYNPDNRVKLCEVRDGNTVIDSFLVPARTLVHHPAPESPATAPENGYALVVASAEATSGEAALAIDGNPGTRWESAFEDPQSITFDLGTVCTITQVTIDWEVANARHYRLEASLDGASWDVLETRENQAEGNRTDTFGNLSGEFRYLRMAGLERTTPYGYSIYEISVTGRAVAQTEAPIWRGFPYVDPQLVVADGWLGWLEVSKDPWVWSYSLNTWIYVPEGDKSSVGGWIYVP
jgi:endoglucanase Acf2